MTFQLGHKLSPGRRLGSRNKRTAEIFHRLENRGGLDPADLLSSIVTNNQEPKELRIQAAGLLMPYKYSKCGTSPVPRFIPNPIDVGEFTHISDAESFLTKIATFVAGGELDFQSALELSSIVKVWIDSQYAREELAIKQLNAGTTEHEQVIRVTGGLPELPGTSIVMPVLDGRPVTNGHALAAPTDAVRTFFVMRTVLPNAALLASRTRPDGPGLAAANDEPGFIIGRRLLSRNSIIFSKRGPASASADLL